jgi:hypothetical protein
MQNLLLLYLTGRSKMVSNYVRKTTRRAVGQDVLQLAKDDLQAGNSIISVAAKYGMDE